MADIQPRDEAARGTFLKMVSLMIGIIARVSRTGIPNTEHSLFCAIVLLDTTMLNPVPIE